MNDKRSENSPADLPADKGAPRDSSADQAAPETLELRIDKLVTGGAGLGRTEGQAVFVPLTAPGDLVRVQPVQQRKGFIQATLVDLLEPGAGRQDPPCPYFGQCGGCDLQHLDGQTQRRTKTDIVIDCFKRLGKLDVEALVTGPDSDGPEFGYRNRIRLFANPANHFGMMRRGTHDIVPLEKCPLLPEKFNTTVLDWLRMFPPVEQIVVRLDEEGNWLASAYGPPARLRILKKVVAALPKDEAPAPGCVGLLFNNLPIWGRDHLVHEIAGHKFRVGAQSFFQGNAVVTEQAIATVRSWLAEADPTGQPGPMLGDLFCGVGLFSLTLADLFEKVVAIDTDAHACRDAENNVKRDPAAKDKVTVFQGRLAAARTNRKLATHEEWRASTCLVDPPRTGLGKDGVAALLNASPQRIIYMSCDPATLARDTAALQTGGYALKQVKVLDMFPQTAHIETLILLEKPA